MKLSYTSVLSVLLLFFIINSTSSTSTLNFQSKCYVQLAGPTKYFNFIVEPIIQRIQTTLQSHNIHFSVYSRKNRSNLYFWKISKNDQYIVLTLLENELDENEIINKTIEKCQDQTSKVPLPLPLYSPSKYLVNIESNKMDSIPNCSLIHYHNDLNKFNYLVFSFAKEIFKQFNRNSYLNFVDEISGMTFFRFSQNKSERIFYIEEITTNMENCLKEMLP